MLIRSGVSSTMVSFITPLSSAGALSILVSSAQSESPKLSTLLELLPTNCIRGV